MQGARGAKASFFQEKDLPFVARVLAWFLPFFFSCHAPKQIVFDPSYSNTNAADINKRRVINGPDDGLMQISPLKHPWAVDAFKKMVQNNWTPEEVPMGEDVEQWKKEDFLTENERNVFKRSLAFVSNLDGLQTNNLATNIVRQITSPEIVLAISRQIFDEALHVQSYAP